MPIKATSAELPRKYFSYPSNDTLPCGTPILIRFFTGHDMSKLIPTPATLNSIIMHGYQMSKLII
uniref:Uncharacterized protein n=1 Tax=Rhizophora mucronata TaxID=61149 RepID=A0A2P2N0G2_RHIMU